MKSTEGKHYVGLDQIRGFAAFLVFVWHFRTFSSGTEGQLPGTYDFFGFSLLAEGHTGVGIFMVLSGYLFVRLTEGRTIMIRPFLYNRFMRLAPLLGLVFVVVLIRAAFTVTFETELLWIMQGFVLPTWPNGGWSIAIEAHFYLVFPVMLFFLRRWPKLLACGVLGAIAARYAAYELFDDSVQRLAYFTIVGRIDQFTVGMLFAQFGGLMARRHGIAIITAVAFLFFWQEFTQYGGFYGTENRAEKAWVWIGVTTIEAVAYGILITYYDRTFRASRTGISGLLAKLGEWSYSIYLLHRFFVPFMTDFINDHIMVLDNFYLMLAWSLPCFAITALVSWLSYEQFEKRFLKNRRPYLVRNEVAEPVGTDPSPSSSASAQNV